MAGSWLPRGFDSLVTWFINWEAKLNSHAATFPTILTIGVLAAVEDDLEALQHLVTISELTKTRLQDINDYKRQLIYGPGPIGAYPTPPTFPAAPTQVLADIIARVDLLVADLKADGAYTTVIGEDLGIEAPAPPAPPTVLTISARALPGSQVEVGFNKDGTDGAWIEGSVDDGPWVHLGNDRFPPFIDTRPPAVAGKAEVRKYRARPLDGDDPVGDWSNIAQVSTIP